MTTPRPDVGRRTPLAALAVLPLLAAACSVEEPVADARARRAAAAEGDVVVAAVWPWAGRSEILFREGLELAAEEINAAGGVNGRRLRLRFEDDGGSVNEGRMIAQTLADDPEVVAVIGHLQSYVTVPAAAIYDLAGLVMVAPTATSPELTSRGYRRVFRTIFTDRDVGRQMAEFAADRGYRRVAICYVRNMYGRALANAFEERSASLGVQVVGRASYEDSEGEAGLRGLEEEVSRWSRRDVDAVFLAGEVPRAGEIIAEFRRQGLRVPVLGSDAMSSPALVERGGEAVEGTVVAAPFHPDETRERVRGFVDRFRARWGASPDPGSALGYDAVRLLAHAMEEAGTSEPGRVAEALASTRGWPGLTGPVTFAPTGDLVGRRLVKLRVRDGRFEPVDAPAGSATATGR